MDQGAFTDGSSEVSGSPVLFCTGEVEERCFCYIGPEVESWQKAKLNSPFRIPFVCPPGIRAPDKRQLLR